MLGWILGAVVVGEMLVATIVVTAIVRGTLGDIAAKHPAVEIDPDAVRRNFQSFKVGLLNMGWSMHVAVDASHLHLLPAGFFRLFGAKAMSVPWDLVVPLGKPGRRTRRARVAGQEMLCPAWCLEIVDEASDGADSTE